MARRLVLLLALALAGCGAEERRTLTAVGSAEQRFAPDLATARLGVEVRRDDPQAATRAASTALERVIGAVRRAGVDDLQTAPVQLSRAPTRDPSAAAPYVARQSVTVRLRDLEGAGAVVDAAVRAGATDVSGPSFSFADPSAPRRRVAAAAVEDARRTAQAMAEAAGVELGEVVGVRQGGGGGDPGPLARQETTSAGTTPPTEPGELEVRATVVVTWAVS